MEGHTEAAQLLLEHGAEQSADWRGRTPVWYAVKWGRRAVVELFQAQGVIAAASYPSLVGEARSREMAEVLLSNASINARDEEGCTALCHAAMRGRREAVAVLLEKGAAHQADLKGRTPLWRAAHREVVEMLLRHGATHEADSYGDTPLLRAARNGDREVAEALLEGGAWHDADQEGCTPLWVAVHGGHREVAEVLLRHGATHEADINGRTPLFCAVRNGHPGLVEMLLQHGATLESDYTGHTLLMMVPQRPHSGAKQVFALLMQNLEGMGETK
eukprot:TRINITY_DN19110_c0_g1_i1.p1 TRINITY_DN19110_c0_g1~~TRINITY_DN19110_c0_g1_i1.p1  ORF type:complete len:320 (-),score=66.12 TRINITY_DN19110_c0_g1_i1:19-840(-)